MACLSPDARNDLQIKIKMPEGAPNVAAREGIMITDVAPIVKGISVVMSMRSAPVCGSFVGISRIEPRCEPRSSVAMQYTVRGPSN